MSNIIFIITMVVITPLLTVGMLGIMHIAMHVQAKLHPQMRNPEQPAEYWDSWLPSR